MMVDRAGDGKTSTNSSTSGAATVAVSGDARPLIAHVVFRFDTGGLENGVANLINRLPQERYRHAVVSLTGVTSFSVRVVRRDVEFVALGKQPGHGVKLFPRLYRVFRRLRPAIVHTRNLAALEATLPAALAGVRLRVHGEHGRDIGDVDGSSRRYRLARRVYRPLVTQYVALSRDLESYLVNTIGVPAARVSRIINGVDTGRFAPAARRESIPGCPFDDLDFFVFGAVGRLQAVKNHVLLAQAFAMLVQNSAEMRARARLVIVGAGPARIEIERVLADARVADLAWVPGERDDVSSVLRALDAFVLPSIAEGISNTILEAMASGLPVIATAVGGNEELVQDGLTGQIVPSQDVGALTGAMNRYASDRELARSHGEAGRARAEQNFGLDRMVGEYAALYDQLLRRGASARGNSRSNVASAGAVTRPSSRGDAAPAQADVASGRQQ